MTWPKKSLCRRFEKNLPVWILKKKNHPAWILKKKITLYEFWNKSPTCKCPSVEGHVVDPSGVKVFRLIFVMGFIIADLIFCCHFSFVAVGRVGATHCAGLLIELPFMTREVYLIVSFCYCRFITSWIINQIHSHSWQGYWGAAVCLFVCVILCYWCFITAQTLDYLLTPFILFVLLFVTIDTCVIEWQERWFCDCY